MAESYYPVEFSPLIIGTMRLGSWGAKMDTSQLEQFIAGCIEMGMTTFDHADIYGDYTTETDFGKVLLAHPDWRGMIQIISKCGIRRVCENRPNNRIKSYDSSAEYIRASVEDSLVQLNTNYLDTLLFHRPDYLMNPMEVEGVVQELLEQGKIRSFGVSNFNTHQFDNLQKAVPLHTNQIEVSLLNLEAFENGTLDQCMEHGLRPMAWSPLGGGRLFTDTEDEKIKRIRTVATPLLAKYECDLDQLLFAWLLRHPARIIPVLGTSKLERVRTAAQALNIQLDRVDWYDLWQASTGKVIA